MKDQMRFPWLAVPLGLLLWAIIGLSIAYANPGPPPPENVTLQPQVRLDLALAAAYWTVETPDLQPACLPMIVNVQPMTAAAGNNGTTVPASMISAETTIGTCEINLSPALWRESHYQICATIAHEYGHSLGLPDMSGNTMMNDDPTVQARQDALCALAWKPKHLTRYERRWLKGITA